ncbi:hypothetical protein P691DRAFT_762264 [Macrolepiota fuliginosa MF-IS2]|uniref:Uncharacterized protein n=1 Tax=Macrolepiota fuliginosa MF-IS2 TaxID=1400762 RepID=A0A9P6C1V0_9AGAR|nr:hypothetical protein P691DRAFT_762264 [Macrolepiota fuliginosa MF-IS2]
MSIPVLVSRLLTVSAVITQGSNAAENQPSNIDNTISPEMDGVAQTSIPDRTNYIVANQTTIIETRGQSASIYEQSLQDHDEGRCLPHDFDHPMLNMQQQTTTSGCLVASFPTHTISRSATHICTTFEAPK